MQRLIPVVTAVVFICSTGCGMMRSSDGDGPAAGNARTAAADEERKFFNGQKPPGAEFRSRDDCDYNEVHLPGRDGGMVHILYGPKGHAAVKLNPAAFDVNSKKWRPVIVGGLPDIIITSGWVYVVGRNVSAGTRSHAIYAPGMSTDPPSKMLADTTPNEDASVSRTAPRLLHIDDPDVTLVAAQSWLVADFASPYNIDEGFRRKGLTNGLDGANAIARSDVVVDAADEGAEDCSWDPELQPHEDDGPTTTRSH